MSKNPPVTEIPEVRPGQIFVQEGPPRTGKTERGMKWYFEQGGVRAQVAVVEGEKHLAIGLARLGHAVVLNLPADVEASYFLEDETKE